MQQQHPEHGEEVSCQVENRANTQLCKQLGEQGEDTVRCQRDEYLDHLHDHRVDIAEKCGQPPTRFTGVGDGITEKQGKNNNLQHLAFGHRPDRVGWKNVHQNIAQRRRLARLIGRSRCHFHSGAGTDQHGEEQRQGNGDGRGRHIERHGLTGDGTHARTVAKGRGAADQGNEYQRHHQQFQRGDKDSTYHVEQPADEVGVDKRPRTGAKAGTVQEQVDH